ncbi:MAG: hypothetical protein ABSA11_03380 [Candidatus Bathyarchaeia archaeon]|jgi:hypothetical protein
MTFNTVRKALDELDAVATHDKLVTDVGKLQKQSQQRGKDIDQLRSELFRVEDEISKLRAKANLKEVEIQRRAQILANSLVSRWHAEEKPWVVASAVEEEIKGYPSRCSASTKVVVDARVDVVVQERLKEGWTPIVLAVSNIIKASTNREAGGKSDGNKCQ